MSPLCLTAISIRINRKFLVIIMLHYSISERSIPNYIVFPPEEYVIDFYLFTKLFKIPYNFYITIKLKKYNAQNIQTYT